MTSGFSFQRHQRGSHSLEGKTCKKQKHARYFRLGHDTKQATLSMVHFARHNHADDAI